MPTPIGHSLVGYAFYRWGFPGSKKIDYKTLSLCLVGANLVDLDFLPGLILGQPNRFHGGVSHSLAVSFLLASIITLVIKPSKEGDTWKSWLILLGLFFSHPILDFLAVDTGYPFGKPLLWPITNTYYQSPLLLFSDVWRSPYSSGFFISLFSWHNFLAVLREIVVIGPGIVLLKIMTAVLKAFKGDRVKYIPLR
jgi:inner membrane protein